MSPPSVACLHASVASHGVEPDEPTGFAMPLGAEHETGWCRDCSEYVQRELGGSSWRLRVGFERGVWRWRPYGKSVGRA
jgi:hypothetical protein